VGIGDEKSISRESGPQVLRYSGTQVLRYSGTQVLRYYKTPVNIGTVTFSYEPSADVPECVLNVILKISNQELYSRHETRGRELQCEYSNWTYGQDLLGCIIVIQAKGEVKEKFVWAPRCS
jgi:hypothetical protein